MPEKTDEDIAALVQQGDIDSFALLITRYEQKILRYAKKFLFNGEDVKDLAQEVFIKAYTNIHSFDTTRSFSPWIYRIAHNEFINALKKKGKEKVFYFNLDVLFPHPIARETADQGVIEEEIKQKVEVGLQSIDLKYREPLILYYLEELDYKEIADILQIPVSTVGIRLRRGKALLKNKITPSDTPYG